MQSARGNVQGDQKVSVHLMITISSSGAQRLFDHPVSFRAAWNYDLLQCLSMLNGPPFTTACCVVKMRMEEASLSLEDSWKCVEKPQPTRGGLPPLVLGGDVIIMRHEKERNQHVTKCCIEPQTGMNFGRELRKHRPKRWGGLGT